MCDRHHLAHKCPVCHDAGFLRFEVGIDDPRFGKAVPCECKKRETREFVRVQAADQWSNLPADMKTWGLDQWPIDGEARGAAHQALNALSGVWVFWSKAFGTGKTGILVASVNECLSRSIPAIYKSVPAMLDDLRAAYRNDEFDDLFNLLKTVQVLALDEFHRWYRKGGESDPSNGSATWADEKMFQIIDHRYTHWQECLTLVATNREPDKGANDPLESRFGDSRRCHIVEVSGGDLRPFSETLSRARA